MTLPRRQRAAAPLHFCYKDPWRDGPRLPPGAEEGVDLLFGGHPVLKLTALARRALLRAKVRRFAYQLIAPRRRHRGVSGVRIRQPGKPCRMSMQAQLESRSDHDASTSSHP